MLRRIATVLALSGFAFLFASAGAFGTGLTLAAAGIADGFTLTTFVSGYSAEYGPLAQGIAPDGNVITGSLLNTKIYVFSDVDGQTLASALTSVPYTCQTGNCNFAMTTAGGQVFGAQAAGGIYEHFANDGTFSPIPNLQAAGLRSNFGMWGDPVNGHIISASNEGLVDIDPVAGTFRVIRAGLFPDGVSVSPDGTIAYVEVIADGTVQSYNIATGALIATYSTGHSPDGTGVISGGSFNGDVIVNDNDGTVGLLDPTTSTFTIIANGGTRGDFVSPDVSNGTLFLSQNEQVARLSCGPNCSIGGGPPPSSVPEPGELLLFGTGLAGLLVLLRPKLRNV
ncbi:MAG: YncE family protein [Terriglobia bacterium]